MPRVTAFPAYSIVAPIVIQAPESCTALAIKRAVGHDTTSWLYCRLPAHAPDKTCRCYYCRHVAKGWFDCPPTIRRSEWRLSWHPYILFDLGARNVRLTLKGGEHFVCVAAVDMPRFAAQLATRGQYGKLMSLEWLMRNGQ